MSVMGKFFEFLGFENDEEPKQKVKKDKKIKASYNFKKRQKVEKIDNFDGVKVLYPEILDDAKTYLKYVKEDTPVVVSVEYIQKGEEEKILSYLMGALEVRGGKLEKLEKGRYYVLLPEDMEIEE